MTLKTRIAPRDKAPSRSLRTDLPGATVRHLGCIFSRGLARRFSLALTLGCLSLLSPAGTGTAGAEPQTGTAARQAATKTALISDHDKVNFAEDLQTLRREMAAANTDYQALRKKAEKLRREIGMLNLRLVGLRAHDTDSLGEEIKRALQRLERTSQRIADSRQALMDNHNSWADTLLILSRLDRRAKRPAYIFAGNGLNIVRSQRLMAAVARQLGNDVMDLRRDLIALERAEQQIQEETKTLSRLEKTFREEIAELEQEAARRTSDQAELERQATNRADRIARLQSRITDLKSMIDGFDASTGKPEPQIANKAAPNTDLLFQGAPRETATVPAAPPKPEHSRFSQLRGHLPVPVAGRVVQAYGDRDQVGLLSKGITLEAKQGSKVTAPHNGKVMFAGPFRNYGQLLIIALGEGYHMLLAGMSRIYPKVGQSIHKGQSLGEMDTQTDHRPTLYVELRQKGEPINPLPWMAASNGKVSG